MANANGGKNQAFISLLLRGPFGALFIYIRIFSRDQNAPLTALILQYIPNQRAILGLFRFWPPPVITSLVWSYQRSRVASVLSSVSAFSRCRRVGQPAQHRTTSRRKCHDEQKIPAPFWRIHRYKCRKAFRIASIEPFRLPLSPAS